MTYKEKAKREEENRDRMYVYSEGGIFCNLYGRSAYAFCKNIKKDCTVNIIRASSLDEPMPYIGVRTDRIASYLPMESAEIIDEKCLGVKLSEPIDEDDFSRWKTQAIKKYDERKMAKKKKSNERKDAASEPCCDANEAYNVLIRHCITEIQNLNMASMTPMESMNLLHDMQRRLQGINL